MIRKSRSIRHRVTLLFTATTAAPILILALLAGIRGWSAMRRGLEAQAAAQTQALVGRLQSVVEDVREEYINLCRYLFSTPGAWRDALLESAGDASFSYGAGLQVRTLYWQFVLTDSTGAPRLRGWAPATGRLPGRYSFARSSQTRFEPFDTVGVAAFLRAPQGTVRQGRVASPAAVGVLRLATEASAAAGALLLADVRLTNLLEQAFGPVGTAYVEPAPDDDPAVRTAPFAVDLLSGIVAYHPDPAWLGRPAPAVALPSTVWGEGVDWKGDRLVFSRVVPEAGLLVGVAVDAEPLMRPARRAALSIFAAAAAAVAVAGVLVSLLTRGFRHSLQDLAAASDEIARGRFGHRVAVRSGDELGRLAGSMNRMAGEIETLTREREAAARLGSVARVGAALAHDLKGMVMGLSLLAENLERRYSDPGSRERALEALRTLAGRMRRMVLRLGAAAPSEAAPHEPVDLNALLRSSIEGLGLRGETRLRIVERYFEPAPVVHGDRDALARVAQNLLSNAGEAMLEGGTLTVTTGIHRGDGTPHAVFEIGDSGPGIDPAFLESRIFHPFETTKQGGLGLGLFISREIVQRHGGTISVRSGPGEGSSFQVSLPVEGREGDR